MQTNTCRKLMTKLLLGSLGFEVGIFLVAECKEFGLWSLQHQVSLGFSKLFFVFLGIVLLIIGLNWLINSLELLLIIFSVN